MGKPYAKEGPSAEDKALDLFADMMIERIQSLSGKDGWKKPWFTEGALQWPKNLNGREYNGMNAMMLLLHCEKEGYKIPRFCTFDCIQRMNTPSKKGEEPTHEARAEGKRVCTMPCKKEEADRQQKPRVSVLKGEHSFPVMLTTFTVVDKETRERIRWDDYKNMSREEQDKYNVYPKMQVFRVFNVEQTNLKEARPELWQKLEQEYSMPKVEKDGQFTFEPVDRMIADNRWICPIKPMYGDSAYFSISKNEIVIPEKRQFKDGESFYSNLFHEMSHSTGAEGQLDRIKPTTFGSSEYAREELVAELTAALTAQRYGMTKHLKGDSAAYLKSWLDSLKESPQFIKTTLIDVKKATSMLTQHIDQIAVEIENGKKAEQTETIGNEEGMTESKEAKVYYASVAYLQSTDDTSELDKLKEKGDYNGLLTLAKEYYDGNGMDEEQTYRKPCQNRGDDLLIEDKDFAVVYNGSVGGTYEVFLKHTEQEVRDHITRYGIGRASEDVKEVARDMTAEEFTELAQRKMPIFKMPNGGLLNLQYNKEKDCLNVGTVTNAGLSVKHSFPYNHDYSLDANISSAYERLLEMPEYQKEVEQEEHAAKSAFHR
ncbi:MAG: zincin-like metallopeptidase domain-containing protein [Prevotella sp.]